MDLFCRKRQKNPFEISQLSSELIFSIRKKISCNRVCKDFVPDTCKRLLRAPFVCNGCPSKTGCRKGSSFDKLTQWDTDKIMNHINSSARASLNGLPPIRLAQLLFDQETYHVFKLREISPDDIILTPDLIK